MSRTGDLNGARDVRQGGRWPSARVFAPRPDQLPGRLLGLARPSSRSDGRRRVAGGPSAERSLGAHRLRPAAGSGHPRRKHTRAHRRPAARTQVARARSQSALSLGAVRRRGPSLCEDFCFRRPLRRVRRPPRFSRSRGWDVCGGACPGGWRLVLSSKGGIALAAVDRVLGRQPGHPRPHAFALLGLAGAQRVLLRSELPRPRRHRRQRCLAWSNSSLSGYPPRRRAAASFAHVLMPGDCSWSSEAEACRGRHAPGYVGHARSCGEDCSDDLLRPTRAEPPRDAEPVRGVRDEEWRAQAAQGDHRGSTDRQRATLFYRLLFPSRAAGSSPRSAPT